MGTAETLYTIFKEPIGFYFTICIIAVVVIALVGIGWYLIMKR